MDSTWVTATTRPNRKKLPAAIQKTLLRRAWAKVKPGASVGRPVRSVATAAP